MLSTSIRAAAICLLVAVAVSAQLQKDKFHHPEGTTSKVNYDSLFADATALAQSNHGRELIDACVTKYGGKEKLRKIKSCRLKYDMFATLSGARINVLKSFTDNRRYQILRHGSNSVERRILNGSQAWQERGDTTISGSSMRYKAELFSFLTARLPLTMIDEEFSEIRYGSREDDSLEYVYMLKEDSLMLVAGVDPRDSTIRLAEGIIYQDGNQFVFKNILSDFQVYEGYLFAKRLINISMGLEVARSTLVNVDINPRLGAEEFEPVPRGESPAIH